MNYKHYKNGQNVCYKRTFLLILNIFFSITFMEIFSEISEIYFQRCLLEDHFLYKNTKVYLLQYSDADFLCFISCLPEVPCKKVFLKISENSQTFQKVYKWSICLKWVKKALFELCLGSYQTSMRKVFYKK